MLKQELADRSVCGTVCRGCGKYRTNVDEETGLCIAGGRCFQRARKDKLTPAQRKVIQCAAEMDGLVSAPERTIDVLARMGLVSDIETAIEKRSMTAYSRAVVKRTYARLTQAGWSAAKAAKVPRRWSAAKAAKEIA